MEAKAWRPWVGIGPEGVVHAATYGLQRALLPVDGHLLAPGDGADVVQAEGMVVVLVRQEHGVHAVQHEPRSLLVEVGATVDEDALALIGDDEGRGA